MKPNFLKIVTYLKNSKKFENLHQHLELSNLKCKILLTKNYLRSGQIIIYVAVQLFLEKNQ